MPKVSHAYSTAHSIYVTFRRDVELIAYHRFATPAEVKAFLEAIIGIDTEGQYGFECPDKDTMVIRSGWITVTVDKRSTHTLEQCWAHRYSKEEKKERLLPNEQAGQARNIRMFHWGSHPDVNTASRRERGLGPIEGEERVRAGGEKEEEKPEASPRSLRRVLTPVREKKERTGSPSGSLPSDSVIVHLTTTNPRKAGSHGAKSWDLTTPGMTIGAYVTAGGRMGDLKWDLGAGFTRIDGKGETKTEPAPEKKTTAKKEKLTVPAPKKGQEPPKKATAKKAAPAPAKKGKKK